MTKLLQDLIAIHQADTKAAPITEAQGEDTFKETLEKWMDQEGMHHWEGARGVSNFDKLLRVIGYRDMDAFLADNSGAYEALIEWMSTVGSHGWEQSLADELEDEEDDE